LVVIEPADNQFRELYKIMKAINVATIVGARPQFIKASAVSRAGERICEIISSSQTLMPQGGAR
jgi:hypothetical protein